jgi:hypothetical protein
MVGFGSREGHVSAIRKVDRPRSHHFEFGSETASEAGSKRFEISQENETVAGGNLINCDIASLTPKDKMTPKDPQKHVCTLINPSK